MKTLRYLTIGTTLVLASLAGGAGDIAAQRAACQADALAAFIAGGPARTCAR